MIGSDARRTVSPSSVITGVIGAEKERWAHASGEERNGRVASRRTLATGDKLLLGPPGLGDEGPAAEELAIIAAPD